ncbi:type IV-A pilus assembly ATPase PilB [Candidatus Thiosymbion oneisti]|uniref:type IV-A pilus assembly ATPase PilB n=1 Tax=Candidatus Thiosymbion oneisti TaxID=589554 RepID=UPI000B26E90E|nr:type IV-A pilus assembly ATPase PilB [Candidatus Thiosymbion oneisti]
MATNQTALKPSSFAWRLVRDRLLSEQQARNAHREALERRQSFVQYVVAEAHLDSGQVALAAADEFGVPLLDLDAVELADLPLDLVDEKLVSKHRALPIFQRGNRLSLGISDPTNHRALEEIGFATGLATNMVLVEEAKLAAALEQATAARDRAMSDILDTDLDSLDTASEGEAQGYDSELNVDDAPIVRYINKVLMDAISNGASDIHFEPYEKHCRIRFRQDGLLREVSNPPVNIAARLVARLKVMSRMNIAERRVPQDGRIKLKIGRDREIDFRVNTLPTLHGEKVVLRILDASADLVGIDHLGFEPEQKSVFLSAIQKPYGMILVTGPTGSGKTVSLYSALDILNRSEVNISTVEDPVEIRVPGINQVNMNVKTGLTFAAALRAFLRQDPDIVMVGEIRDLETAEIAVKAAQTGHLVLSTLHTNDAPQSLTRLANMGIPLYNIASSVHLIMAQRLARRLCPHCKEPERLPRDALLGEGFGSHEIEAELTIYRAVGCEHCTNGYRGRVGIFQAMPISEAIGRLILGGGNALELAEQARLEGVMDLRESGLSKVKSGITSLEEINRVIRD